MAHKTGRVEHQTSTNSRDHQIAKTDIIEARALISDNPDDEGTVSRTSGAALNGIVKIQKKMQLTHGTHTRTMCGGTGGKVDII